MSWRRLVAVMAATILCTPSVALAVGAWPWPVGASVTAPYGAVYSNASGQRCTHGGVDIGAEPGASVRSCSAGRVVFAGLVPAGEGMRAYCVTVLTADDLKVTYLPLERASVRAGDPVAPKDVIGVLAASGDASSPTSHLHLGVRRGERQLDPAGMLGSVDVPGESPPAPAAPRPPADEPGPGVRPPRPNVTVPSAPRASAVQRPAKASAPAASPRAVAAEAAEAARRALILPTLQPLPRAWAPMEVRPMAVIADAARARSGLTWLLLRLALAAVAVLSLRPVLRRLSASVGTPIAVDGHRVRG